VFDVDPRRAGDRRTAIQVTYLHGAGVDPTNPNTHAKGAPNPNYTVFETFRLTRPRSDQLSGDDRPATYAGRIG
jgi:hypothetical protein